MFTTDSLKQLLSTKWSRHQNVKVSLHNMYPDVPNMKVFDITAWIGHVMKSVQLILMLAHWTDCLQVWAEPRILPDRIVDSFDIGICKLLGYCCMIRSHYSLTHREQDIVQWYTISPSLHMTGRLQRMMFQ